jgi:hypothetical protein
MLDFKTIKASALQRLFLWDKFPTVPIGTCNKALSNS